MSKVSKCQIYKISNTPETVTCDTFSFVSPKPQTPLHVTPFPWSLPNHRNRFTSSLPNHRNRYMWHLFPCPSQASETVTCDTFSLVPPKPQKPLHVTPFPWSLQSPRNRYMSHLFLCPSPSPETVTCDTFSHSLPNPRHRYIWHLFPLPSKPQKQCTRLW